MPYFLVDDQFQVNAKVTALVENEADNGLAALGLWVLAGSLSQAKLSDGEITRGDVTRLVLSKQRATRLAALLVRYGLFDDTPNGWAIHDFKKTHKQSGDGIKLERERRAELRRPEVTRAVKARDGDHCRYCGRKVNWPDKRGPNGATFDHVDPTMAAGASNVVVACRSCNSTKGSRSLEEAGMKLRPAPPRPGTDLSEPAQIDSGPHRSSGSNLAQVNLREIQPRKGDHARARVQGQGKGWVGEGSGEGEPGVTTGWAGEVGPAGDVPPGSVTPPGQRPQPTGSAWHGYTGPPVDPEQPACERHPEQLVPCRRCAKQADAEDGAA